MNFAEGIDKIPSDKTHYQSHYKLRSTTLVFLAVTANYLFSKYRLQALIIKILFFYRCLLN